MTTAQLEDQRMSALAYANEVRAANKLTKQLIGSLPRARAFEAVAAIVRDPEGHEGALQVGPLLKAIPLFGRKSLDRAVVRFGLRAHAQLRELPPGRRGLIATHLEVQADRVREYERSIGK